MVYRSEREEITLEKIRDLLEAIKNVDGIKKIVDAIDVSDRETRKLGEVRKIVDAVETKQLNPLLLNTTVFGSQNEELIQRDLTFDLLVQLRHEGAEIDPRDVSDRAARLLGIVYGDQGQLKQSPNRELLVNPVFEPHGSKVIIEGTASPTAAGEVTIGSYTPADGEVVGFGEVIGGGSIDGYVTIYWGTIVKWRGRFIGKTSVGQQFKVAKEVTGDGTTALSLKVYASEAGDVEAFLNGISWT